MARKHSPSPSTISAARRRLRSTGTAIALATPWTCALAALGLGIAGVVTQSATLAGAGALAGGFGVLVAAGRLRGAENRASADRWRLRTEQRRLLDLVATLRARVPAEPQAVDVEPPVPVDPVESVEPLEPVEIVETVEIVEGEGDEAPPEGVVVPDGVPGEMPAERPTGAPPISMELPVLSSHDEAVASGRLAAVIELRGVQRPTENPAPLPIGELDNRVYAAIAAQEGDDEAVAVPAEEAAPVAEAVAAV